MAANYSSYTVHKHHLPGQIWFKFLKKQLDLYTEQKKFWKFYVNGLVIHFLTRILNFCRWKSDQVKLFFLKTLTW